VANGGVVAGMLAGEGPAEVTIMRPVPVDAPLTAAAGRLLDAGGTLLAEATPLSPEARSRARGGRPGRPAAHGRRGTRGRGRHAARRGPSVPDVLRLRARPPERPALPGRPGRATACGR
jgi:hypothetical protein